MHIVELTDFYRPVIGGLERHVETLSRGLAGLGHTVTVVTLQTGDDPAEEVLDGVRVVRIRGWSSALTALHADAGRPFHPTFPDPGAMAAVHRVVQSERPDVVHSHSWLQYSYFPWHRTRKGPAHVVTLHDYGLACAKKTLQYSPRRVADPAARAQPCSGPGWPSAWPARRASTARSRGPPWPPGCEPAGTCTGGPIGTSPSATPSPTAAARPCRPRPRSSSSRPWCPTTCRSSPGAPRGRASCRPRTVTSCSSARWARTRESTCC